jgi:alkaline phosphatase
MSSKCTDGFFLLSEASAVDKSMHAFDYERGLADLLELDRTVKKTLEWSHQQESKTGIIVTADHSQTFDVFGSVDVDYFNSLPSEDSQLLKNLGPLNEDENHLQIYKRSAIGTYENAGWPDLVVDDAGIPTKWKARYRLANGKVDATQHTENYQLHEPDPSTNPLTRLVSIKDEALSLFLNETVYVSNPKESDGLHVNPNLPVSEFHAVHSLQAVDVYCHGPDSLKIQCSRVMDNTELFFIMADVLGLGHSQGQEGEMKNDETQTDDFFKGNVLGNNGMRISCYSIIIYVMIVLLI